jgi:hypothetical protein
MQGWHNPNDPLFDSPYLRIHVVLLVYTMIPGVQQTEVKLPDAQARR